MREFESEERALLDAELARGESAVATGDPPLRVVRWSISDGVFGSPWSWSSTDRPHAEQRLRQAGPGLYIIAGVLAAKVDTERRVFLRRRGEDWRPFDVRRVAFLPS